NRAAGAADILDNERLPQRLGHLVGDDARNHIARASRRERHDHRDRPRRGFLRTPRHDGGHERHRDDDGKPDANILFHYALLSALPRGHKFQSPANNSATSTRRPSCAERMPARTTASDLVAYSPPTSCRPCPRTAAANSSSSSTRVSFPAHCTAT